MEHHTSATTRERLRRELFEGALDIARPRRREYLVAKVGGDRSLLESVLRLLDADATTDSGILDFSPCSRQSATPRPEPVTFGPYRVVRRIGEGGMGAVFVCRKQGCSELVAAKMIRSSLPMDEYRDAFERERQILAPLRHRNICHLIDAGIADYGPFLIMDYVRGEQIDSFCRARQFDARDRLVLLTQVLAAMEYLHNENVVHRDLKPSNILVTTDGVVKILDFGISKIASHAVGMTGRGPTASRNASMSLRYASPEQLNHTLSGRSSDLYAVGIIAYELLTGHHPYGKYLNRGATHLIRAQNHRPRAASTANDPENISGLPRRLREFSIRFRAAVDQLLLNALGTESTRRYRTAAQFLADVRLCLDNGVVTPLKPGQD